MDSLPSLGTFDFLVVGAGASASGLLKALLNNDDCCCSTEITVAVLEQGGDGTPRRAMNQWATASQTDGPTILAKIHGQRTFPLPVAMGLGGNTRVYAGLVVPPAPDDFTALSCTTPADGIQAVDQILKCLPIHHSPPPTAARLYEKAVLETPVPWNTMTYPSVCFKVPCCVDSNGKRVTYFEALVPKEAKNLEIFLHHKVERIEPTQRLLIVRHVLTDRLYRIHATRDIILCAGTVETPALLISSGLMDTVVTPVVDHQVLPVIYVHWPRWNSPQSNNGVSALGNYITKSGARIQVGLHEGQNLIDLTPYLVAAITWFHYIHPGTILHRCLLGGMQFVIGYTPLYFIFRYCVTVMTVFLMNPDSKGTLTLIPKITMPMYRSDYDVSIDLMYLSDVRDVAKFEEAWKHPCFSIDGIEIFPLAFSRVFARLFVLPYFHWMGTCRCIDKDWCIPNVPSVRVCDASILPGLSAPTALTCASLGYLLGNRLKKNLSI